jgi:hypothetical protein
VVLQWDPSTDPDVAGYKVYYCSSIEYQENIWENLDVGNSTSCVISGLVEGETYYFAVTAYDERGYNIAIIMETSVLIQGFDSSFTEEPIIEVGEVKVDHNWKQVSLGKAFVSPVVVAGPISFNGFEPAVIRIRSVGSSSFEIRLQEWEYTNGIHMEETVSYVVMEAGSYVLADGTYLEAGRFYTNNTDSFGAVGFGQTFQTIPVVVTTISSNNGSDAVTGRLRDISRQGFQFCMQEQEANPQVHASERIFYIAWEPSSGNLGDLSFEVNKTQNVMTDDFETIYFNGVYGVTPAFLADMQTSYDLDTANLRLRHKDPHSVEIQIDEEQSLNSETKHFTEQVGYMVFGH